MPKTDNLPPRSKDSLKTILVQISHHQSKDNPSLPNDFPQKLNSKEFKFGDAVINCNGSKGIVTAGGCVTFQSQITATS